ncbi:hypothetical protein TrVFT333_007276 [Trichoderma virens FT-333]|nr:hypothetical protein TrVFT333_007276 [Trichoderma virens FT-333]
MVKMTRRACGLPSRDSPSPAQPSRGGSSDALLPLIWPLLCLTGAGLALRQMQGQQGRPDWVLGSAQLSSPALAIASVLAPAPALALAFCSSFLLLLSALGSQLPAPSSSFRDRSCSFPGLRLCLYSFPPVLLPLLVHTDATLLLFFPVQLLTFLLSPPPSPPALPRRLSLRFTSSSLAPSLSDALALALALALVLALDLNPRHIRGRFLQLPNILAA